MSTYKLDFAGFQVPFILHPHGIELSDVCYYIEEDKIQALMHKEEEKNAEVGTGGSVG